MLVLQRFIQICLFRAGPADLPMSRWLFKLAILGYLLVGTAVSHVDNAALLVNLVASLADTVLMMLTCWLLLWYRGLGARYLQTVTAMAGAGSVMGIVGLPLLWLFRQVEPHGQLTSLVLLLVMVVVFWSLLVTAHIFRQALEIRPGMAAIVTVLYTIVSLIVVGLAMNSVI